MFFILFRVDLLPYDLTTQMFRILTIDTKQEKDYKVDPTDLNLTGLESFSFDYLVKWPVSLVVNRKVHFTSVFENVRTQR